MKRQERRDNGLSILGVDPGSRFCGYGVVSAEGEYVASGRLKLSAGKPLHERLLELHEGLSSIIREFSPGKLVVEKVFFAKSVKSALTLGQAWGVVLLAGAAGGLEVYEHSPLEVKKAVTGYGKAEKRQVKEMVRKILKSDIDFSPDSADALALALCHINAVRFEKATGRKGG